MKKLFAILLALAIALPCAALLAPAAARADQVYIIPDSNTRELTYAELWDYSYDTLMFAFNEILARHGYKFETGSRCYNWFTQMPWYKPNMEENSKYHTPTYKAMSKLENQNFDLIKQVRRDMKAQGTTNANAPKKMPTPPARQLQNMAGFTAVTLKAGQKFPVMSAPNVGAFRANNGKALVSTNGAIYTMGWDSGWLLIMYETKSGARLGYIDGSRIHGKIPADIGQLAFANLSCKTVATAAVTDDPAWSGSVITTLPAGTQVTYLSTMYFSSGTWDYIETYINGQVTRGCVREGCLDIDDANELDAVDEMEQMDEEIPGDG